MEMEQPVCRICFIGGTTAPQGEDEGQRLVSPCRCEGSQKYVHLACLRRWQRSIQLAAPNQAPNDSKDDRHQVCNVCKVPFSVAPQSRSAMMSELAGVRGEEIVPGLLVVTKRTASEPVAGGSQLNSFLRAFVETKAAHFREAVYVITDTFASEGSNGDSSSSVACRARRSAQGRGDGSDIVIGVNLCRALDTPDDVSKLHDGVDDDTIQSCARQGVEVLWMNGGPVQPKAVTAVAALEYLPCEGRAELLAEKGVKELIVGDPAVVQGNLEGVLSLATKEAAMSRGQEPVIVLAWAGFAQWTRTQLLGELARGSWGWCSGRAADITTAAGARRGRETCEGGGGLFGNLRHSNRLKWAPDNEFAREFESRTSRSGLSPTADATSDSQRDAVANMVQQFERLRRSSR